VFSSPLKSKGVFYAKEREVFSKIVSLPIDILDFGHDDHLPAGVHI